MLELHNVSVDIVGVPVLRDVHMVVPPGGRVALIGRNGAGKTTTLRTLMGLLPVRAGRVTIDGQEATTVPAHRRAALGIGYAPEERRLFGSFSVQENMLLPAQVLKLPAAEVARRLEAVFALLPELKDLAPRRAAGLSGGQGKMVALGRALMTGTRVVLLDEPFQGLAPKLAMEYAEALGRLRQVRSDLCVVVTESNASLLGGIPDQVLTLERGALQVGAPAGH